MTVLKVEVIETNEVALGEDHLLDDRDERDPLLSLIQLIPMTSSLEKTNVPAVSSGMAIWRTWTRADGTRGLLYRNHFTRTEFRCGVMAANVVLEWIVTEGKALPWDLISFDTGTAFMVMPQTASS